MSDRPEWEAALEGRYRIDGEAGRGGMATVYLAHDERHGRRVALKVLDPEIAAAVGSERFLAEIRTTARLQHPHILPLYDSGEAAGRTFYVMPYVEGESLRERLDREGQLPLDDAVRIAREVADALQSAHAQGIVHRDVKPENIMLQGGHALVADFGIALALETVTGSRLTQTGLSLGTPRYMSPEQALGERGVDARSDVYALGAVTYEMLVGEPPFDGATVQSLMAKVMAERPTPPSTLRDTVPPTVEAAVLQALARLPADRFASASAFAAALGSGTLTAPTPNSGLRGRATRSPWVPVGVAFGVAAGTFAAGWLAGGGRREVPPAFGQATQVTWEPGLELTPALSPDGGQLAYAKSDGTRSRIFVRPVAGGRPVPLTDDSTAVESHPEWSRDGSRILFLRNGQVFSAPPGGGTPRQEAPSRGRDVETATWSPDGTRIAYVVDDSVFIREPDGISRPVATVFQASLCAWGAAGLIACQAGNRWYLKPGMAFGNLAPSYIALVDPDGGPVRGVTDTLASNVAPRWSDDGRTLFYVSNRLGPADLYARDFDDGRPGPERRLTTGLGLTSFSLSSDGSRLAYAVMTASSNIWSEPWPRTGEPRRTQHTFGQQVIERVTLSADGRWLYYDSDIAGNTDLYRMDLAGGTAERLTTDRTHEFAPDPSPDGRHVAFHSWRATSRDIYVMPLDGGPLEQVTDSPDQEQHPVWSPDGSALVFASQSDPLGVFIARRDADGRWTTRRRLDAGHWVGWSPDGRSLSYTSTLLGGGLRVADVDSGPPRALFDESGPDAPRAEVSRWSDDGRTIWFKAHDPDGEGVLWSVPASGGTPTRLGRLGDGRLRSDRYGFALAGGRIYYTLFDRQSNLWVMEVGR